MNYNLPNGTLLSDIDPRISAEDEAQMAADEAEAKLRRKQRNCEHFLVVNGFCAECDLKIKNI